MKTEILHRPAFSSLKVYLEPGEEITAAAGAMVYMDPTIKVKTTTGGGLLKGLARRLVAGEPVFVNTFYTEEGGYVTFAPSFPGDIEEVEVKGSLVVSDRGFLAMDSGVNLGLRFEGFRGIFTRAGLFWINLEGHGKAWISAYGGIEKIELKAGQRILVDNINLLAFDGNMDFEIRKFGGLKSFFFGGEYFLTELRGPGRVYIQTRDLPNFAMILSRYLPQRRSLGTIRRKECARSPL